MTNKSFYAIRTENFLTCEEYGYMGKGEPGCFFTWYLLPAEAKLYKLKKSADRLAKYYRSVGIECQVVEIIEDSEATTVANSYRDVEFEAGKQALIDRCAS